MHDSCLELTLVNRLYFVNMLRYCKRGRLVALLPVASQWHFGRAATSIGLFGLHPTTTLLVWWLYHHHSSHF